ncbi:hypothetical protein Mal4_21130 [Maioricimonas rarisocia]|uniref:Uncharacterized protein n=1 Tax=Maioricimonas rarisocia TaxID=2528026 RepID=A0A517Z5N8_9PLAN|nr:hypothetical protein Mal4_21130 [Maioricimonas rarisocia]
MTSRLSEFIAGPANPANQMNQRKSAETEIVFLCR